MRSFLLQGGAGDGVAKPSEPASEAASLYQQNQISKSAEWLDSRTACNLNSETPDIFRRPSTRPRALAACAMHRRAVASSRHRWILEQMVARPRKEVAQQNGLARAAWRGQHRRQENYEPPWHVLRFLTWQFKKLKTFRADTECLHAHGA